MQRHLAAEFIGTFSLVSAVCGSALFSAPQAGLMAIACGRLVGHGDGFCCRAHLGGALQSGGNLRTGGCRTFSGRPRTRLHCCSGARRRGGGGRFLSCAQRRSTYQVEYVRPDFQPLWRWRLLYGRRVPHRDCDHRTVPRGDRRRDFKRRARRVRTDCDRTRTDHVSPCRHTDIECFINPARATATAIFGGSQALNALWLFWVAPILGGVIGGGICRWLQDEMPKKKGRR